MREGWLNLGEAHYAVAVSSRTFSKARMIDGFATASIANMIAVDTTIPVMSTGALRSIGVQFSAKNARFLDKSCSKSQVFERQRCRGTAVDVQNAKLLR